jgi:threonine/homoserine/homoserine lactone efflux protein
MFNTEFLITSLIVVLIPGTGVIYTVSIGLFLGWRASIAAACGCTAGIFDLKNYELYHYQCINNYYK